MTFLKPRGISKDLEFVRSISKKIDKKFAQSKTSNLNLDNLSLEELQDLNKLVGISDFLLNKYNDKKETREILEYFVSIVKDCSSSIEQVDDEVSELIISAEDSINKIKEIHTNISEKYDLEKSQIPDKEEIVENSSNNLTKFVTEINSKEYQQNSTDKDAQVI